VEVGHSAPVIVEPNIVYATGAVRSPTVGEIPLLLDLWKPADVNHPALRPGLILIHGGSFTGGSKSAGGIVDLIQRFAQRGYVTASIDYRLVGDDPPTEDIARDPLDPVSRAAAAAMVDAGKAVEWMRANAAQYRIDPNRIAIGGYSAGAITSMKVAYRFGEDPDVGGADVQAVLSLSGGLYGYEDIIEAGEPPLIMIHGTLDSEVSFSLAEAVEDRALSVELIHEFYPLEGVGHDTWSGLGSTFVDGISLDYRIANFFYDHLGLGEL
jgi:dienelactone hydrolase